MEPITIELDVGYTDKQNVRHTRVTFGRRIKGRDLFAIDENPQSGIPTQYNDLILREAITEFGTVKLPVPLDVLLGLDALDRDDLWAAFNRFLSGEEKAEADLPDENAVRLLIGYERNGLVYDVVRFGLRLRGMDEVAADARRLNGIKRGCFLVGRQIKELAQTEGESVIEGPIELYVFEELDIVDITALRVAAEVWRQSFRRAGARVQGNGSGPNNSAAGGVHGLAGEGDPPVVH